MRMALLLMMALAAVTPPPQSLTLTSLLAQGPGHLAQPAANGPNRGSTGREAGRADPQSDDDQLASGA